MQATSDTRLQVRRVLIITLILNLLVAFGKIVLGMVTGALAITADGFHSLTDGAGNVAGLVANVIASQPPDDDHPYGHHRFETLAALLIGALLLLTAWELLQSVLDRFQTGYQPTITGIAFVVLMVTLIINIGVSRYQTQQGKQLRSEILLADAKNTRADVFVTLSVIVSTAIVSLTGWVWVDIVAACVVAVLVGKAAWEILSDTGRVLVDTAPYSPQQLTDLVCELPQVQQVVRARSRGTADAAHIDIDLHVAPEMTADQTNSVAYAVRQRLEAELDGIQEIEVHFLPYHANGRDAVLTARAYADAQGLSTHEVQISRDADGTVLEMHVEVPSELTLAQAHDLVSQLEGDVGAALPEIDRVVTHIEPKQAHHTTPDDTQLMYQAQTIAGQASTLLEENYPQVGWHDLMARPLPHGYAMNLHATMPAEMSLESAHAMAETAETLLRGAIPDLKRVTIHTEPDEHLIESEKEMVS